MKEHGEFRIEVEYDTVHSYPTGAFNEYGIQDYCRGVLAAAAPKDHWLLFEHPRKLAGLTPEAIDALVEAYHQFQHSGCQAIAVEVSTVYASVLRRRVFNRVTIAVEAGQDERHLQTFLDRQRLGE